MKEPRSSTEIIISALHIIARDLEFTESAAVCEAAGRLEELDQQVRQLQGDNKALISQNQYLRQRPDLPVDRIPAYKKHAEQIKQLEKKLSADERLYKKLHQCLDDNNMLSSDRDKLFHEHEKLKQENVELRLSNQEMKDWIAGEVYQGEGWEELNGDYRNYAEKLSAGVSIIESAPTARLAELKAAAIAEAIVSCTIQYNQNDIETLPPSDVFDFALDKYDQALLKYADHLRKEAQ